MARKKDINSVNDKGTAVYHNQLIIAVTITGAILLFMSNFDLSGIAGKIVSNILFGFFGLLAFVSPIILVVIVYLYLTNRESIFALRKFISSLGFVAVLCSLIQLASYDEAMTILQCFTVSSTEKRGGGLLGGILSKLLYSIFGYWGSFAIMLLLLVVFSIIISEKLIFDMIGKICRESFNKAKKYSKDDAYYETAEHALFVDTSQEDSCDIMDVPNVEKKRKLKVFTFLSDNTQRKYDDGELDDIQVTKPDDDSSSSSSEYIYDEDINENIYEQELNSKFGDDNDNASPDIRELANSLIYGDDDITEKLSAAVKNMTDELESESADTYTFEQSLDVAPIEEELVIDGVTKTNDSDQLEFSSSLYAPIDGKSKDEPPIEVVTADAINAIKHAAEIITNDITTPVTKTAVKQTVKSKAKKKYKFPSVTLLNASENMAVNSKKEGEETAKKLIDTLESFGVQVTLTNISYGPVVTRYEIQPAQGVKVSKITNLIDDIRLNLAAAQIRIEAPIPGKAAIGIEVPNKGETKIVHIRELIESKEFKKCKSSVAFAVGKDISGQTVIADIAKMPHLLIAGQTGSGKSVCINTLIMSILYKANPDDVKLIMIDPKVVELSIYNGIPHLLIPVVTDPQKASGALNWAVTEMTARYQKFADMHVRDITSYNTKIASENIASEEHKKMHQIVIIVDELADLMMVAPNEVEDAICRLAQMARAAGIHLIIATQRPSVNVITGLIKANIPSRIAFSVASAIDSRTILDGSGAEKLLSRGDMLFFPTGYPKPVRVQGAYISDKEVSDVVEFLAEQNYGDTVSSSEDIVSKIAESVHLEASTSKKEKAYDDYFVDAAKFIIEKDKASIGMLQRVYKIGFNRAARIMDQLYEVGVVGQEEGTKPRTVLMTSEDFEKYLQEHEVN